MKKLASKKDRSSSQAFPGFPPELFEFLSELKKNNDRDWFTANKSRYEQHVLQPSLAFIQAMEKSIAKLSEFLVASPKRMGGSLMRIYRDTRFSPDKTPYKTNVGMQFRHRWGADVHAPGLYLHLEPKACFVAAGVWMPPSDALQQIRQAMIDDPAYWKKARDHKSFRSRYQLDGESLKTAPRGIVKNHPLIEDLRRKSIAGISPLSEKELISSGAVTTVYEAFADAQPLMRFLCDALKLSY